MSNGNNWSDHLLGAEGFPKGEKRCKMAERLEPGDAKNLPETYERTHLLDENPGLSLSDNIEHFPIGCHVEARSFITSLEPPTLTFVILKP